jgi:hypothetical protein
VNGDQWAVVGDRPLMVIGEVIAGLTIGTVMMVPGHRPPTTDHRFVRV